MVIERDAIIVSTYYTVHVEIRAKLELHTNALQLIWGDPNEEGRHVDGDGRAMDPS